MTAGDSEPITPTACPCPVAALPGRSRDGLEADVGEGRRSTPRGGFRSPELALLARSAADKGPNWAQTCSRSADDEPANDDKRDQHGDLMATMKFDPADSDTRAPAARPERAHQKRRQVEDVVIIDPRPTPWVAAVR